MAVKKRRAVKKAAKKSAKKAPKVSVAGRMDALVALVNEEADIAPKAARKVLKLSASQMQTLARNAGKQGLIKVMGQGRGTRYQKA